MALSSLFKSSLGSTLFIGFNQKMIFISKTNIFYKMFKVGYTVIGDLVRYIGTEDDDTSVKMYYIPKKRYDLIMMQSGHEMHIDSYRHDDERYYKVGYANGCRECNHHVEFTNNDNSHTSGVIFEHDYDNYVKLISEQREKDKKGFEKFKEKWIEKCLREQENNQEGWTTVGKRR